MSSASNLLPMVALCSALTSCATVFGRDVDVAAAWGPLAGYFTQNASIPLEITPMAGDPSHPNLSLTFNKGMGVRSGDTALNDQLTAELTRRHTEIMQSYGIPQISMTTAPPAVAEN